MFRFQNVWKNYTFMKVHLKCILKTDVIFVVKYKR